MCQPKAVAAFNPAGRSQAISSMEGLSKESLTYIHYPKGLSNHSDLRQVCPCRYVLEGPRVVAVMPFRGRTQTPNYSNARKTLLQWAKREGLRTVKNEKGKSRVWVYQHGTKAGFNMAGSLCLGIYEQPWYSDAGEIAVELDPAQFTGSRSPVER
jgi:hypothetical protein